MTEKKASVKKRSMIFALGTMVSRLTGVVREAVLAAVFGATTLLDAFLVANRIPNMLREMFAEGALGSSFTQRYAALKAEDENKAQNLLKSVTILTVLLMGTLVGLGILFAPSLVDLLTLAGGEEATELKQQATALTRVLFPFILLMSLSAVFGGVLNERGKFFISSVAPVGLNLGYIIGGLVLAQVFSHSVADGGTIYGMDPSVFGLALGVLLGGLFQTVIQFAFIARELFKKGKFLLWNDDVKAVFMLMGPMVLGASAGQINVMVNTNFATSVGEGAVSWLSLSFRILQLPIGLFSVAAASVILPSLTKKIKTSSTSFPEVGEEFSQATKFVLWLLFPCMTIMIFAGKDVISLLLGGGKFNQTAVENTGAALSAYGFGVLGYGLIKIFTSYFYATGRATFPMKVSFISIGLNFVLNYFLVSKYGHVGLAATTALVFSVNSLLLLWGMRGDGLKVNVKELVMLAGWLGVVACVCGFVVDNFILASNHRWLNEVLHGDASGGLQAAGIPSWLQMKMSALINVTLAGGVICAFYLSFYFIYAKESPSKFLKKMRGRS